MKNFSYMIQQKSSDVLSFLKE